jgi:hypothetical protein
MAEYYKNRPTSTALNIDEGNDGEKNVTYFDKHRKTLLMDDAEEGWASELRRYLDTMQRDVKKDTDLVEWWQVYFFFSIYVLNLLILNRTMHCCFRPLHALQLTYFRLKPHLFPASACFRAVNKLQLTAVRV